MSTTSSQILSSALTLISANIEGLSAVKASMLSDLGKKQHCHCLCLQETHRGARKERPRILGMTLVAERPHDKYGSAIFIRDDLKVKSISVTTANHDKGFGALFRLLQAVAPYRLAGSVPHKSGGRRVKSWPDYTQTHSSFEFVTYVTNK